MSRKNHSISSSYSSIGFRWSLIFSLPLLQFSSMVLLWLCAQTRVLRGLAPVNVMAITETMQLLIMQWSILETSFGAVSRTEDYATTTEVENTKKNLRTHIHDWRSKESISFSGITVRHARDEPEAVLNITSKIPSDAKVWIFGRSGSGKSSSINPLWNSPCGIKSAHSIPKQATQLS